MSKDYEFKLSEKYLKIAESELQETLSRRNQSLEQLIEWIQKHPNIKKCPTCNYRFPSNYIFCSVTNSNISDPIFLLRFLRAKKFSVPMACEMLERYLVARQVYKKWFNNLDIKDPKLKEMVQCGIFVPLPNRDELGRKICLIRGECLDPERFTADDIFRLNCLFFGCLLDEEESQIAGYVFILDLSKISMKFISSMSLTDLKNWISCFVKAFPLRMRQIHIVNLPRFAKALAELGLNLMSEKLKKRVNFVDTYEELGNHVHPKLLPKEYCGVVSIKTMIEEAKDMLLKNRKLVLSHANQVVTMTGKMNWTDADMGVGSFRKLDVD